MTPEESLIINTELDRMTETYGIEYADYGFTGSESYRVALAIILDREDAIKETETDATGARFKRGFEMSLDYGGTVGDGPDDGYRSFYLLPGSAGSTQRGYNKVTANTYRTWHDYEIDDSFELDAFDREALTPEIEEGLLKLAAECHDLFERAERLMKVPGPNRKTSKRLWQYLSDEVKEAEVLAA